MNLATALVVLLGHAGFWVGGQQQNIDLRWPAAGMPAATVAWDLSVGQATLLSGETPLAAGDAGAATVRVVAPNVRAATDAVWRYRVVAADGRELLQGRAALRLMPDELARLRDLTADTPLHVLGAGDDGLTKALSTANASFERLTAADKLPAPDARPVVVVAQDFLTDEADAATPLLAAADAGASVLVLRQTKASRVLGYAVARRDAAGYTVDERHPLLRHLPADAWAGLFGGPTQPTLALPADEAALEIIHSPVEVAGVARVPLDTLLVTRTVGRGRIVLCQLPLGDARTDARQQRLLINLIEYARTRPQPTPARSDRPAAVPPAADDPRQILQGR